MGASSSEGFIDEVCMWLSGSATKLLLAMMDPARWMQRSSLREGPGEGPSENVVSGGVPQTQELLTWPLPRPPAVILESMS